MFPFRAVVNLWLRHWIGCHLHIANIGMPNHDNFVSYWNFFIFNYCHESYDEKPLVYKFTAMEFRHIHQLIFCISNSLQGFLIFLFHIYLSKPKRELWRTFFIQHGLHQQSNSLVVNDQKRGITSHSNLAHLSSLTRPVKIRFTSNRNLQLLLFF